MNAEGCSRRHGPVRAGSGDGLRSQEAITKYQTARGMRDILPDEWPYWARIESAAAELSRTYGYRRIVTPMVEDTGLFFRGVGEGTDIVDKEMYTFEDRGGNSLTLRPEGTAPVARAYLEHGMRALPQPVKLYYIAPNFRYERPQAGRHRQHHQFGVEAFGEADPSLDAEMIDLAMGFCRGLEVSHLTLHLNSIGCPVCRPEYLDRLVDYYRGLEADVCGDCRRRMSAHPLRLLDCKVIGCQPAIAGAPQIVEFLCEACAVHFTGLRGHLAGLDIGYSVNPRLVRGLDYYNRTIFELWAEGIGPQSAVGGGGRYDGLIETLGGPPTPGIGFGIGLERVVLAMQAQGISSGPSRGPAVYVLAVGARARERSLGIVQALRRGGISVACSYADRSLKAQMRAANASGALRVVILGEDEVRRGMAGVKDLATGEQVEVPLDSLVGHLGEQG